MLAGMVQSGLLGRKSGCGFYLYAKGKEPQPNPQVSGYQSPIANRQSPIADRQTLQERMVLLMVNEAARCLEEQIASDPADIDFAMIMGTGFAPFRGGPLRYADTVGAAKLAGAMDHLAENGAAQFRPCELLRSMAKNGEKFYGHK